jgi:tetratricopeptide (TPR) repeat protein
MGVRRRVVQALVVGAILAFCATGPAEAAPDTARALNAKGYAAYKQKRYAKAAEHFREAVEADESCAPAHYNLACALGVLRKRERDICQHDAYRGEIDGYFSDDPSECSA